MYATFECKLKYLLFNIRRINIYFLYYLIMRIASFLFILIFALAKENLFILFHNIK